MLDGDQSMSAPPHEARDSVLAVRDWDEDDIAIDVIGTERAFVMTIDGFYVDPDRVRALALAQSNWQRRRSFPGVQSSVRYDTMPMFDKLLERIDIEGVAPDSEASSWVRFSALTTKSENASRLQSQLPHYDHHSHIAGLVYLNPPGQCRGGTAFYRHRQTGLEGWPFDANRVLGDHGIAIAERNPEKTLHQHLFPPDNPPGRGLITESNEHWEKIHLVPMRYNRAVFYATRRFHAAYTRDDFFGDTLPTRRLTQTIFLKASSKASSKASL